MRCEFESAIYIKELLTACGESLGLFLRLAEEIWKGIYHPCLDARSFSFGPEHNVLKQLTWYHLFLVRIVIRTSWVVLIVLKERMDMHVDVISHPGIGTRLVC